MLIYICFSYSCNCSQIGLRTNPKIWHHLTACSLLNMFSSYIRIIMRITYWYDIFILPIIISVIKYSQNLMIIDNHNIFWRVKQGQSPLIVKQWISSICTVYAFYEIWSIDRSMLEQKALCSFLIQKIIISSSTFPCQMALYVLIGYSYLITNYEFWTSILDVCGEINS